MRTLCVQLVGHVRMYVRIREEDTARYSMESLFHEDGRTSLFDPGTIVPPESKSPLCQVVNCFIRVRGCTCNVSSRNLATMIVFVDFLVARFFEHSLGHRYRNGIENGDAFLRVHANKTKDIKVNYILTRMLQDVGYKTYDRSKFYPSIT